jgi:prevent-host-death family protein
VTVNFSQLCCSHKPDRLRRCRRKIISAGKFKANCLAIMDDVKARHETVVITKHGEPVAKLVPVASDVDDIFGFFSGSVSGDVLAPALLPEEFGSLRSF